MTVDLKPLAEEIGRREAYIVTLAKRKGEIEGQITQAKEELSLCYMKYRQLQAEGEIQNGN